MISLAKKFRKNDDRDYITVVSGLPRSGTSMMMKMLEAGGLEILTDNIRTADEDNPKGYYEFEPVKKMKQDTSWLPDAQGKGVKIISMLLQDLPLDYHYKVIFIRRNMSEILASQKQMLIRRGEPTDKVSDEELAVMYENHLRKIEAWLNKQTAFEILYVNYNECLKSPAKYSKKLNKFLDGKLNGANMASVIDSSLYRQRS
ncbi:MAG: sulfotransferase domain-containing protein [Deltaproteobacteria bacterium]|nr:sulfotransferase domain-containing protein [Deltaproteobacteria bacterium]MBW2051290.1 sulfotransferase domain-containing protein [Deltaproteobacteria bacterium]MBW2140449.1 sulfotransferase domain-containing protein [Deltaproteobacteria bacterium]MBW2323447.1 sulfotransferase domain-containing protein [Deltaproteobacteria bacterium]